MRSVRLLLGLWICVLTAAAQAFGTHWIAAPQADSTAQVWFRQTYLTDRCPAQATVTVASAGNFELYVNQWNVSTDVLAPFRAPEDTCIKAVTYDVTRFLRPDSNVIAVWYAPASIRPVRRQISVTYSGTMPNGTRFSHVSNPGWLCRPANRVITPEGSERVDGREHDPSWNAIPIEAASWRPVLAVRDTVSTGYREVSSFYPAMRVTRLHRPSVVDTRADSVIYEFPEAFTGWVRVTLRNTRKGQRIRIGDLEYICNGKLDEQACRKFTLAHCRRVTITGDARFSPSQLFNVEGVEIRPSYHHSYQY